MVDWVRHVRARLDLKEARHEWEAEVVEDLARQLEDAYRDARLKGETDEEAEASTLEHIADWHELRRQLLASRRAKVALLDHWYESVDQASVRQGGWWKVFPEFGKDALFALRMMRKDPAFTSMAVLVLALGIGINSAMFSVVNAVILRPLPYREPGRLVLVQELIPKAVPGPIPVSAPDVLDFERQNQVFEAVAGFEGLQFELTGAGQPAQIRAARVGAALFPLLGIQPLAGTVFSREDDQPGRHVVVLSYGLWQSRFGGNTAVIGKTVALDRKPYTVIGVMPRAFLFPPKGLGAHGESAALWVPIAFNPDELAARGDNFNIGVVARLRQGITLGQAQADANTIARRILETYPASVRGDLELKAVVTPLHDQAVSGVKTLMATLLGAVGLVLLIACANIANLLLARALNRQREIAIRAALGAGRRRLIRQFLSESLLLSFVGGAVGLAVASLGTRLLLSLSPGNIPGIDEAGLDLRVVAFTVILSMAAGLAFGLAPAFAVCKADLAETLKEGGRGSGSSRSHHRLRSALVVGEVAVALLLLVGAGLLLRSFERVRRTDPGFQPEHVQTLSVSLPLATYSNPGQIRSFYRELLERLRRIPGAESAGMSTDLPMLSAWTRIFTVEGHQAAANAPLNLCMHSVVYGDYFKAMGIPLVAGRFFTDEDRIGSIRAIIISESIARRYFAGKDAVGGRLKWGVPQSANPWMTVVGVVGDVKQGALDVTTKPHTYEPYAQAADGIVMFVPGLNIALRAAGNPLSLSSAAQAEIRALDRQLAVSNIRTMNDVIDNSISQRRFDTFLIALFAGAALFLAAIGLYGVISYMVTLRTHEIGLRMALGAKGSDVLRLVVGQGMLLTAAGIVLGLAGAAGLTRVISSLLYDVPATDPLTFTVVPLVLACVALTACYIPARRATRVDPLIALHSE